MHKNERKNVLVKKISNAFREGESKGISRDDIRNIFMNSTDGELKKSKRISTESGDGKCPNFLKTIAERVPKICGFTTKEYMYVVMFLLGVFSTLVGIYIYNFVSEAVAERCLILNNVYAAEMSRPLVQCGMCRNLESISVESNISSEKFKRKYAYTSVPVLVKNATSTWSAMSHFNFQFFKDLYIETEGAMTAVDEECQFFSYQTDFDRLSDVLYMSEERANFTKGEKPWYIGWSNCHKEVRTLLRKHYERPYFLPNNTESSNIDWIFMGGSGPGAGVHLDYVNRPSWQAQISGTKTWTLIPPPECDMECKAFDVTVNKGDIFVVDTNVWYHSTFIHPGEISITIGSEYD